MKLDKSFKELLQVAAMSSIVGAVGVNILERPKEARTAELIDQQKKKIAELQDQINLMGQGGITAEDVGKREARNEGVKDDENLVGTDTGELPVNEFKGCQEELRKCQNREIGQSGKDLWTCGKMADAALYLKSLRSTISCNTSRKIHELIAIGLERCGDAIEMAVDPREKAIIQKEVRRLNVLRADKEVNPESCVKVK